MFSLSTSRVLQGIEPLGTPYFLHLLYLAPFSEEGGALLGRRGQGWGGQVTSSGQWVQIAFVGQDFQKAPLHGVER